LAQDHTVAMTSHAKATSCREDQTILDAYLRAGLWIPHSCTQGTCGTCKVKIISGKLVQQSASEYALSETERAEGKALACQAQPRSDIEFEPDGTWSRDESLIRYPLRDYIGTVAELVDIARDTRRLVIELDDAMEFNAGQYADITVTGTRFKRAYSMANPTSEPWRLEFHIRRMPGGVASERWVFDRMKVGDRIKLAGPLGEFHYHDQGNEPAILIGGGTGLAPLKSIALYALAKGNGCRLYLYHGVRTQNDLYDVDFFRELQESYPSQFSYHPCLSDENWNGATGMVTDAVVSDFVTCKGHRAYVCGPPAMVEAAVKQLKRKRMTPRNVFREEFLDAAPSLSSSS
jgi:NAD(P)H-flavin reductase/ferredoxin